MSGRNELALAYDAEIIKTAYDALSTFIRTPLKIRLSNRKILSGLLQELGLEEKSTAIFGVIDHAEKVPKEKTLSALAELGLVYNDIDILTRFMSFSGNRETVIAELNQF